MDLPLYETDDGPGDSESESNNLSIHTKSV